VKFKEHVIIALLQKVFFYKACLFGESCILALCPLGQN